MASFRSIVSGRQVWNGEDVANGRSAGISLNHIFSAKTMKTERLKHEDKILKSSRHPKQCKQKDTALRLSFTMKSIPSLAWALARKRPCKNHGKASSARRLPLEADDWWSICWEDLCNLYPQILSLMMEGVLIQPSNGAWIGFQPAVRYVEAKLGWVNVFWGGTVGRVVARNFPILQIHPQFGYSTSWVFFLSLASGGDLDSIHGINDSTCSKDATDVKGFTRSNGHVETCSPMKPCPQFARVASIDFHTLQPSEWMGATGGQWGWRWRFRPCFSCFLLAQELWVHVLWILKISSSSIPANKKAPWRWSIHFDGIFYALVRSSSETERVTKVGFSCEYPSDFFSWKFWGYTLDMYHGTGKNPEETCGTCGSNVPLVAFIWK